MKSRARTVIGLLVAAWAALSARPAATAEDLVVDLSAPVVAITTGFTGADLLLFGVVGGAGDVVVVVRGPARDETVRRKKRIAGIWVNRDLITFEQVPSFYATATNRPLNEFVTPEFLLDNQIGVRSIELKPKLKGLDAVEVARFRDAPEHLADAQHHVPTRPAVRPAELPHVGVGAVVVVGVVMEERNRG